MLLFLYACESNNLNKNTKKNKKNQNIQMEVTTKPTIKIKK